MRERKKVGGERERERAREREREREREADCQIDRKDDIKTVVRPEYIEI